MIIKSIIKCVLVVSWDSKTLIEQQQQQLAESVHLSVLLVISLTTSASYVVTLFTCQIYECAPAAANAVASCDTALMFRRRSRTPHAMTTSAASVANRLSPSQFHCTQAADIASDPITHICLFFTAWRRASAVFATAILPVSLWSVGYLWRSQTIRQFLLWYES